MSSEWVLLADEATFLARKSSAQALLGTPSISGGTLRSVIKWSSGTLRAIEFNAGDWSTISSVFTGAEQATRTATQPGSYTAETIDPDEIALETGKERYVVVCHGDSITYGTGSSFRAYYAWPPQLGRRLDNLTARDIVINKGSPGSGMVTLLSEGTSTVDPILADIPAGATSILCFMGGTNDVASRTPAAISADIETYRAARVSAGWDYILIGGITERSTYQSTVDDTNTLLLATYGSALVRTDLLDLNIPDGVHPDDLDASMIAQKYEEAIKLL